MRRLFAGLVYAGRQFAGLLFGGAGGGNAPPICATFACEPVMGGAFDCDTSAVVEIGGTFSCAPRIGGVFSVGEC